MRTVSVRWFLSACVILLTSFIAYRAVVIPVTHDEASTWLSFRHYDMWSCYENYYCWQTANNHWLNTLLMQWSADLFGDSSWALRLPNVVAGFLYCVAAALFSARYIRSLWLQIPGFLVLTTHLYLLDFFSLFRGYGLMVCGVLWAVYFIMRYIEQYEMRFLFGCVLALFLGVLSNFTALLPMASIGFVWFVSVVIQKKGLLLFKHGLIWIFAVALLSWWSAYPIRIMADAGEFSWGSKNLLYMIHNLAENLLYGSYDIKNLSTLGLFLIAFLFFVAICFLALWKKHLDSKRHLVLSLGILISSLVFIALNQLITGSHAPLGRQSLFLIPLLFVPLALGLNLITHKTVILSFSVVISTVIFYHIVRQHPWKVVREWYYDAYYPELFSSLPELNTGDSIRLGASWIFTPSLLFYQQTKELPVAGLLYQKPLVIDTTMQYYYVEGIDTTHMSASGFVLQKNIGPYFLYSNIPHRSAPDAPSH